MNPRLASTAVMARRSEPADSLDYFPTPPWATRAFCTHVLPRFEPEPGSLDALEPACGEGHMALALAETFGRVTASDVFDYGYGEVADFLHPDAKNRRSDWIVTNPPFNRAVEFIQRARRMARRGVAILVRTAFLEGEERHRDLFADDPPALIAQFSERAPMHKGRWSINGTTATAYCWLVWHAHAPKGDTRFVWIPKSRRTLSKHDDWLRFMGSEEFPEKHPVRLLMKAARTAREAA